MVRIFTILNLLLLFLMGSHDSVAQEKKKEFRPVPIVDNIDKPEGMAVIGNTLYISQYHKNGSIIKYDLATRMVSGKLTDGLDYPTGLQALNDVLYVLEFGTGSLYAVDLSNGQKRMVTTGFSRPADIILFQDKLLVSDFGRGVIYAVDPETHEKSVFASGLSSPAGMTVFKDQVHVVEWGMHRVSRINSDRTKEILVREGLSSPWGLMTYGNDMYVAESGSNQISRISEEKIPVKNVELGSFERGMSPFQDSISVWKMTAMNCHGLSHPEAFTVSERGIFVSEWKSREVSEILLNSPPSGQLILTGKAKIGNLVVAEPQNIQDEDGLGTFTYGWQISDRPQESGNWVDIPGNEMEYKVSNKSMVGKFIRAVLSYTDQGGLEEKIFSNTQPIMNTFSPLVTLSVQPEGVFAPGDTVTVTADFSFLDEDAKKDKVEFYCDGLPLMSLNSPPYQYNFVVQGKDVEEGYINQLSITAKGYDSNGLFGEDEQSIFVTNKQDLEDNLSALLGSSIDETGIFPNPFTHTLNVVHKGKESMMIRVVDMKGNVVLSTLMNSGFKALDVSRLLPGAYIIEYTEGAASKAQTIIKL